MTQTPKPGTAPGQDPQPTPGPGRPPFDLEDRTFQFARDVRAFVRLVPRTLGNREDVLQLVRSSGSVGANYIEANEGLSRKDFLMRIKICRKEAKESAYWLRLLFTGARADLDARKDALVQEAPNSSRSSTRSRRARSRPLIIG
jgi:four helix bundle protein